ncbi:hypothetical protein OG625_16205 [Streptomyces sp. NBC_01351]|uniref:hypothetical protein n=1 Tax=Streptomyces sp. NBC_01351 TaxID=2903833 RepID=UPI002E32861F|nr:hypothetical protein [Streptomyces sp. NBC_01351]
MTASRALVYDTAFRARATRKMTWGFGLLAAAAAVWLWIGAQLLLPFTPADDDDNDCESRVFYEDEDRRGRSLSYVQAEGKACDEERDVAVLLALALLSLPFAAVGTVLYTSGRTEDSLSYHASEVKRLTEHPYG